MQFGERRASSIDLCVRDQVRFSRFRETTTIIGDPVDEPFPEVDFRARPVGRVDAFYPRMWRLIAMLRGLAPDVVSVQEQWRTAVYLAKKLPVPILMQQHNSVTGPKGFLDRTIQVPNYNRLGGVLFVSSALCEDFERLWPRVSAPRAVVRNGLDMTTWQPAAEREKVILVVGRANPHKGIKETAEALLRTLPNYPEWRTVFILNEVEAFPDYLAAVRDLLDRLGDQATLLVQEPFVRVKYWMENAAIVIVPTITREPFGRTALEAHAGGACVISSGTGGLSEVSGDCALYLQAVTPDDIAAAIVRLIEDPERRTALAQAGQQRAVALFDVRGTAAACDDAYERAIARNREAKR